MEEEELPATADSDLLLTTERVESLCEAALPGTSLVAAARLFRAFRACAHYGDALGGEEEGGPGAAYPVGAVRLTEEQQKAKRQQKV